MEKFYIIEKSTDEILQEGLLQFGKSLTEVPYNKIMSEIKNLLNKLQNRLSSSILNKNSIKLITHGYPEIFEISKKDNRCGVWYESMMSFNFNTLADDNRLTVNTVIQELIKIKDDVELESNYFECNLLYTNREHTTISLFFTLDMEHYCLKDITNMKGKNVKATIEYIVNEVENNKKKIIDIIKKNNFKNGIKISPIFEKTKNDYDVYRFHIDKKNTVIAIPISDSFFLSDFDKSYHLDMPSLYYIVYQNLRYALDEQLLKDTNLMLTYGVQNGENKLFIASKANIKITNF